MKTVYVCVVILIINCLPVYGKGQKISRQIDSMCNELSRQNNFTGTVLLAKGDDIFFENAYGYADISKHIRNDKDARFAIGSISKTFTAVAILKLYETGKLDIEKNISPYFPSFGSAGKISIRNLLNHSSGLKREIIESDEDSKKSYTTVQLVDSITKYPLVFEPGSKSSYSNAAYALLARIIELASGMSYEKYLEKAVLRPLGMSHTFVAKGKINASHIAHGYEPYSNTLIPTLYEDMSQNVGSGSIYSTIHDLLKWKKVLTSGIVLSKATRDSMVSQDLGFGLIKRDNRQAISHNGVVNGFVANFDYYPGEDVTIIFLSNVRTGCLSFLSQKLPQLYFSKTISSIDVPFKDEPLLAMERNKYTGSYQLFPGFTLIVQEKNGHLMLKGEGGYFTTLNHIGTDSFFYRSLFAFVEFSRDANNNIISLNWRDLLSSKTYNAKKQ